MMRRVPIPDSSTIKANRKCIRKCNINALLWATVPMLSCGISAHTQTLTASETVALSLSPAAVIYSVPSSLTLVSSGSFSPYSGSLTVSNEIRTSSTGSGSITLQATSDFSPATGPTVSAGMLKYQCSSASYGTPCSGSLQASTGSQTSVVSFSSLNCTGAGAPCSTSDPNVVTLQFSVNDSATYKTGSYTAMITFTISAS